MELFLRDIRRAIRRSRRTPGLTATIVLTLSIGIGSNAAVFSAIDAILLSPLPYPNADQLVQITQIQPGISESPTAPIRLDDWNRLSQTFEAISGFIVEDVSDTTSELPERIRRTTILPRFFDALGVAPTLGRDFTAEEHRSDQSRVVVISDRYWRSRLGSDPNVLSRTLRIADDAHSIVGVMPASFAFPATDIDVWTPYAMDTPFAQIRQFVSYLGVARLLPGVSLEQARTDLGLVQARLADEYPDTDADIGVRILPLQDAVVGETGRFLWLIFGAVLILLMIACVNIAALLLSQATQREQEIAVRFSLGASRGVIMRQLLIEAGVFALAGAAVGTIVAVAAPTVLSSFAPNVPRLQEVGTDARTLLYLIATAIIVALLCGLYPAARGAARSAAIALGNRTQVAYRYASQWTLVGAQVALSVTLLIGAGLLLRSAYEISRVDLGLDPTQVLAFRVGASLAEPGGLEARGQRINRTVDALASSPGIESASASWWLPSVGTRFQGEFEFDESFADGAPSMVGEWRTVTPGYFATLQIPLVEGELCRLDTGDGEMMVNRSFAERYLADRAPIGLRLREGTGSSASRIVGVVGDAREIAAHIAPVPTVYFCFSAAVATPWFLVRTRGDPLANAGNIRQLLNELEPLRAVYDISPFTEHLGEAYAEDRLRMSLLVAFAATALGIACLGVYGTLSYAVTLRRREIGLRVALGASTKNVVSQFIWRVLRVVTLGSFIGVAFFIVIRGVLSGVLYGVSPTDPITISIVIVVVVTLSCTAAFFPAVRASKVQPTQALRED